jgi:hypothetical protein
MSPVDVLRVRPWGRAGVTDQELTGPPVVVGTSGVMATPFVKTAGLVA